MTQAVNNPTQVEKPHLATTTTLAHSLGVDPSAVRRWVESGKLTPAVTTPGGHYRFDIEQARMEIQENRSARRSDDAEAVTR